MENIQKQKTGFKFGKYRLKVLEEYGEIIHNGRKYKLVKVQTNDNLEYISLRLYNKNNKFIKQFLMEPEIIKDIIGLLGNISDDRFLNNKGERQDKKMKKITVIVKRNMFPNEESYQAFINFEEDQYWYYNITQNIFSKGDVVNAQVWHDQGDEYLAASEIRDILKTDKPDEYDIFYEPHPLWGPKIKRGEKDEI